MAQTITPPPAEPPVPRGPVTGTAGRRAGRRKPFLLDIYSTAVGKKYVMAITGIIGIGFVVMHMLGNLKVYLGVVDGRYDIDVYGEYLREILVPILPRTWFLWILRLVLIGALVLHVHAAYGLTVINRKARPVKYASPRDYVAVSFAARTMRWSGIIVGLFLLWHLADLTWGFGFANPDFVRGEAYENVAFSLERWPVAIVYILGNLALGFHLYHGSWSIFQTIGSMSAQFNPRHNPIRRGFAAGLAIVVAGINITFPIAVLAGIVSVPS